MEYLGAFAFIMMLVYSSYPGNVKHLEAKVKRMERKQKCDDTVPWITKSL